MANDKQHPARQVGEAGLLGWAIGYGLATFGVAATLDALSVPSKIILGWFLSSWGILVTLEPELIRILLRPGSGAPKRKLARKKDLTPPSPTDEGMDPETEKGKVVDSGREPDASELSSWIEEFRLLQKVSSRRILELVLMIVLASLGLLGSRGMRPPAPDGPATVKLSDADESALRKCLEHLCADGGGHNPAGPNGGGTPSQSTLKIDPELQKALTQLVEIEQKQISNGSMLPWGISGILLVLLIAAAIVVAGFVAKEHPSTAAPLGAAGLAAAAIKQADHLSRLDPASFWAVLFLFAAAGTLAVIFGFKWKPVEVSDTQRAEGKGRKRVESPMNTLFSFGILLWAVMVICYRVAPAQPPNPPPPPPPPVKPTNAKMSALMLPAITNFSPYSSTVPNQPLTVASLAGNVTAKGAADGDLLILLGSADCQAIHAPGDSNAGLARRRANAVRDLLVPRNLMAPENIHAESLEQPEKCKGADDLRAVFPVLIHVNR